MPGQQQGLNSTHAFIIATQRQINNLDKQLNILTKIVLSNAIASNKKVEYIGSWNAATNSPVLGNNGTGGKKGDMYDVTVAGTTSVDGESIWAAGDFILHNGAIWQKINNADVGSVISVNGKVGAVVINKADVGLSNVTNESKEQILNNSALTGTATLQNKIEDVQLYTGAGNLYNLDVNGKVNNIINNTTLSTVNLPLSPENGFTQRIINYGTGPVNIFPQSPNGIENFGMGVPLTLNNTLDKVTFLFIDGIWNII